MPWSVCAERAREREGHRETREGSESARERERESARERKRERERERERVCEIPNTCALGERDVRLTTLLPLIARGRNVLVPAVVRVALCPSHRMAMHRNVSH